MERLKMMKESLMSCAQSQMSHLDTVDAKELGEVVDMIKDLEEAMYYCSIVKSMEKREKEEEYCHHGQKYMSLPPEIYYTDGWRDLDREMGRLYYPERNSKGRFTNGRGRPSESMEYPDKEREDGRMRETREREYPMEMRDYREGSSPIRRKYYMEAKELHQDKKAQMEELEKYMRELSKDITEMIQDASPEETQLLKQKLVTLSEKIK